MGGLKFLVVDGNARDDREAHRQGFGKTPGVAYGDVLMALSPGGSAYDICLPADEGANLPTAAGLADYDGIALTGSALHVWNRQPAVERQIELAREAYRSKTAFFGSCWGVQIACVAAGGDVRKNPLGREIGIARNIAPNEAGRQHPLLAGRPAAFDAPAIHLDAIIAPPAECRILASNALTPVQAAEMSHEGGTFWGVQYRPEFSLTQTASILRRMAVLMTDEGFARTPAEAAAYADELAEIDRDPARLDLAWRHGLDAEVLDEAKRLTEIRNWIEARVKPLKSARGRA